MLNIEAKQLIASCLHCYLTFPSVNTANGLKPYFPCFQGNITTFVSYHPLIIMSGSNKEEGPLTRSSAKASAEFLVEFLSENHPPGLLPVKLDVLRETLWQEESGGSISCPSSGQCSVRKLLVMWREAGIKTLAPRGIKFKIDQLLNEYKNLRKSKNKQSEAAVKKRNDFCQLLAKDCFDILAPDAKDHILQDRLRTQAAKDSDLAFIEDQLNGARKMKFTSIDRTYRGRVEKRKSEASRRVRSEEKRDIVDHLLTLEVVDTSFLPPPAQERRTKG